MAYSSEQSFYQNKILQEIKNDFTDLSSAIGIEEWHQDADWFLPEEHIDKDEALYETTGEVKLPLCSAILYLRVENLVGANLKLVRDNVEVTPKPGTLVLLSPGLLHSITDYESGKRISLNMNIWDSPPIIS